MLPTRRMSKVCAGSAAGLFMLGAAIAAQQTPVTPRDTLPDGDLIFDSSTRGPSGSPIPGPQFRVAPIRGFNRPYALAFLPDGRIVVSERAGRLRLVKDGQLDPDSIAGVPPVLDRNLKGFNDIALHPQFATNGWIYFTYYKPEPGSTESARAVLGRGRVDGRHALSQGRDLFATSTVVDGPSAARFTFGPDGMIYLAIGIPLPSRRPRDGVATTADAQDPNSHFGKILRLTDEGQPAPDNPFRDRPDHKPEVYALGIRNAMGLAFHPDTGELWETENGPQGGDEINIIRAGKNYGWPVVSFGRSYGGDAIGDSGPEVAGFVAPGFEGPLLFWSPSIALTGIAFYRGAAFPAWRDSIFVGALLGTQLQRVVFNQRGLPVRRYPLLFELKQRIMDVREGPDGLLYLLTDEAAGALLRLEPVPAAAR